MRSLLFFNLPMVKPSDIKAYRLFLKNIKRLGFYMIQESVYVKMSIDAQNMNSTIKMVEMIAPKNGSIFIMNVTEKQFSTINIICGDMNSDVISNTDRTIIL